MAPDYMIQIFDLRLRVNLVRVTIPTSDTARSALMAVSLSVKPTLGQLFSLLIQTLVAALRPVALA